MRATLPLLIAVPLVAGAAPSLEVTTRVPPTMPREAYALPAGTVHTCHADVTLSMSGVPTGVVVSGCPDLFHPAVRDAVSAWRWRVRVYDGPLPESVQTSLDLPFRVPDTAGRPLTTVAVNPQAQSVAIDAEVAIERGMLTAHSLPALPPPAAPCRLSVAFDGDGVPVNVSPGTCPPDVAELVLPALWAWRAVPAARGSARRVDVRLGP
jgi:hypothetical protein